MSSKILVIFLIFSVFSNFVSAVFENNPFLSGGAQLPPPGDHTPSPPAPGYIWLQVPISYVPQQQQQKPVTDQSQPLPGVVNEIQTEAAIPLKPSITQKPPSPDGDYGTSTHRPPKPITEPIFTIEPPWVLQGDLSKKCLKPRGQFPSYSCKKYVNCWDGVASEEICPGNFIFNPKGYCDFPENVKCSDKKEDPSDKSITFTTQPTSSTPIQTISSTSEISTSSQIPQSSTSAGSILNTRDPSDKSITFTTQPTSSAPIQTISSTSEIFTFSQIPQSSTSAGSILNARGSSLRTLCLKPRGQFPSFSCSKYINCWDDSVVEQECPEGLLFSSRGYCDFAQNVECNGRSIHTATSLNVKEGPNCPLEHGTFRDRTNCTQYFTCLGSKIVAKYECPVGFSFNDNLGVCDYSYRVDCSKEPLIFHTKNASSEVSKDLECPVEYGIYRDKTNCRKYYICVSKRVIAQHECPIGYSFNDNLGSCDYANRVDCQQPPKIFQMTTNTYVPQFSAEMKQKVQQCQPGTVFRLNPQCTAACRCTNGLAEIIRCSEGLAYDSTMDKCIPLNLAKC